MSNALSGNDYSDHRKLLNLFKFEPVQTSTDLAELFPNYQNIIADMMNVGIQFRISTIGGLTLYKLSRVMEGKL